MQNFRNKAPFILLAFNLLLIGCKFLGIYSNLYIYLGDSKSGKNDYTDGRSFLVARYSVDSFMKTFRNFEKEISNSAP